MHVLIFCFHFKTLQAEVCLTGKKKIYVADVFLFLKTVGSTSTKTHSLKVSTHMSRKGLLEVFSPSFSHQQAALKHCHSIKKDEMI